MKSLKYQITIIYYCDTLSFKEVDPFDTSNCGITGPSKTELKLLEGEILSVSDKPNLGDKSNQDILAQLGEDQALDDSIDPFDTEFASEVLPDKGDPFDTSHVGPHQPETEEDPEFDPFDTSAADQVIPVRKPKISQRSTISIEDDDFDPESSFQVKKARRPPPARPSLPDPFAVNLDEGSGASTAKVLTPVAESRELVTDLSFEEDSKKRNLKSLEEEFLDDIGGPLKKSFTDDDFNPRGSSSPEPELDEDDPFDTSNVQL